MVDRQGCFHDFGVRLVLKNPDVVFENCLELDVPETYTCPAVDGSRNAFGAISHFDNGLLNSFLNNQQMTRLGDLWQLSYCCSDGGLWF